jgi:lipopolysaccharide export LptBFGC system permease protein LptF
MLYLLPATLPCTVPCGFAVAVSWMDSRRSGALQSAPATLVFASGLSIVALITVGWFVPASNQAYRTTVEGWQIPRGFNELTLPEQRRQLSVERERLSLPFGAQHHPVDPTFDIRGFEFTYHGRFAVSAAPLALGLFGLGISRRGYAVRRIAMLCVLAMYFIWYGWDSPVQTLGRLSPALVAWLPNLAILTATTLLWTGARAAPRHLRAGGANGDRCG